MAVSWTASLSSRQRSSSSRSATYSPCAARTPVSRAAGAPPGSGRASTRRRDSSIAASTASVAGSGPYTTTTLSRSRIVWAPAVATAAPTRCGRFRVAMTTLTVGEGPPPARSASLEHRRDRPEQDLEVEPHRPAVDVGEIELDPPVEVLLAPSLHLPQPGDAGLHRQPAAMPQVVALDLPRERWSGSDEAHLAADDVPQLRQLVEARRAQDPAGPGQPRIVGHLEGGAADLVLLEE